MAPKKKAEPSQLEQAMALLINSTVKNTQILEKVSNSLDEMNKKLDHPVVDKQHQIDLDQENKMNPFKIQMRYQVEQRTLDLWDWMWDYEDTAGKIFFDRTEAEDFGKKNYWVGMYRIIQIEAPMPS